ncbi:ankyrin repeat and MYND domain-containing protein 1-like isoform X2 [Hyposmocoma kahamanoa]|uniref:ankyrin repeat and MYND domain-containing protein 1-like isoform X2 n=1 Tax=Hyposmocoma kahamanoa TaxID=1477025 RepID=UPI000E6D822D|nr:ankyrin repeat and MYND domain-containing protein 1-like isoform X2 [Hyposmocoma kahamanoa]
MVKSGSPSDLLSNQRKKSWPYDEYYFGERDDEERRNGQGENHWTGAESIEYYIGNFVRNTMHGLGDYRWRFKGQDGVFVTYEGQFYANNMHGYGTMSYPDGKVFTGIFYKNMRFGPGIEHVLPLRCNVGFWYGNKLVRISWSPAVPSILPDFCTGPTGPEFVEPFRKILSKKTKIIGETNSAIELLKQCGADPMSASQKWTRLYPKFCTDLQSELCYVDAFDRYYYKGKITSLKLVNTPQKVNSDLQSEQDEDASAKYYYAWNNSDLLIQMMQHCFKHESQRKSFKLDLPKILNGPRKRYRPSDKYEKDCRTVLMASYLGHIVNVAQLVNEYNVYPNIADIRGNTALMYATAGDQPNIIHFLVEAGANVNSYNDSCCTALGIALIRYLCVKRNVVPNAMIQSLLPPAVMQTGPASKDKSPELKIVSEWLKSRITMSTTEFDKDKRSLQGKSPGKIQRKDSLKKVNSASYATQPNKSLQMRQSSLDIEYDSDESFSEDKRLYSTMNNEYIIRVNEIMSVPNAFGVNYLFELDNITSDVLALEETLFKSNEKFTKKNSKISKLKMSTKSEMVDAAMSYEKLSTNSIDKLKDEISAKIMLTIIQLLDDGADPNLVVCPQPALYMAILSSSSQLVQLLIRNGADINTTYFDTHNYTPLEVAISRPLNLENLEVIKAILESGADTNRRLYYTKTDLETDYPVELPGPTLIHAVLAKHTNFQFEDEIRNQLIELLLAHNCDPTVQFKGRSAIDLLMMTKIDLIDIFMRSPNVDLNAVINMKNQTILVKMFEYDYFQSTTGMDRLPILTNLLLYGADPLIECRNEDEVYGNVFAFANKTLNDNMPPVTYSSSNTGQVAKGKKASRTSKFDVKNKGKSRSSKLDEERSKATEYQGAVDLMRECARLLHIRWLQGNLMKELIDVIYKYKHRTWNMIFKEHKNPQSAGLWLTTHRCLEIWDVLKTTNKKLYTDDRIFKHLLRIIQFYNNRLKADIPIASAMTTSEKNIIETDVSCLIHEHRIASKLAQEAKENMKNIYVKPEFAPRHDKRFQICFECALPIKIDKSKVDLGKEKSLLDTSKSKLKTGILKTQSKLIMQKNGEKSMLEDKLKSKLDVQKNVEKTIFDVPVGDYNESSILIDNMDNFLCPMCELVRFCNLSCLKINVDRANCHPCSKFLKAQYFISSDIENVNYVSDLNIVQ